jgi:hypothetical protein
VSDATTSWVNALALIIVVAVALVAAHLVPEPNKLTVLTIAISVILSALPGLFYLRFIQFRGPAVWNEYVYNLHRLGVDLPENLPPRLDEAARTAKSAARSDRPNIYTAKFDAHYGRRNRIRWQRGTQGPPDQPADQRGARATLRQIDAFFPILVATLAISIGWAVALTPPFALNGGHLLNFLRFGFLGAYIFVVQFLIRRFFQNDLKATAYWTATERLVIVPIIVVVLYAVMGYIGADPQQKVRGVDLGLAFFVGVFPLVGFRTINSLVAAAGKQAIPTLEPSYPLSDLDGMTIWYEARLLEEGIEDMQSLVTANIVDVMLQTRIPVGRLVDWLDQAHLYLHMAPLPATGILPFLKSGEAARGQREASDRMRLRRFGIRTATDLEDALDGCTNDDEYRRGLEQLLDSEGGPSITRTISNCLKREPMLVYVENWKSKPVSLDRPPAAAPLSQAVAS